MASPDEAHRPSANPVPFVVALVGVALVAVLGFMFLREDDDLEILRPDSLRAGDGDTVNAVVDEAPECTEVVRAQVDVGDEDRVFVELIARTDDECVDVLVPIEATVDLPEPIDGRRLVAGVGRTEIPCEPAPATDPSRARAVGWLCTAGR